ncbi:MAG: DUF11 domain-containing protein, partial [Chloroflexi bacterium]|nr:DUF11 domain-containing protein [Chloroflexota bacterium]
ASVNTTVVNASGDLIVTQSAIPDPVTVGQPLLYTVIVTNQGPSSVSGVTIVDFLPADVVFNSFSHSTGVSCVAANGAVTCGQSTLAANAQASVTIAVTPTAVGSITNTVSASASVGNDPNLNNNSDIVTTSVSGLEVVVGPASPPTGLTFTNLAGDPTTISIPGGAVSETIRLVYAPVTPSAGSPGGFIFTGHAFTLEAYTMPEEKLLQNYVFSRPLTIDITYSDNDVSGVNDESGLMLYYLNGSNWVDVATTCVPTSTYQRNTNANTLAVDICHLTE